MHLNQKIIKRTVESAKPDKKEELWVWDSEIKGFGLRVYPSGRKIYFVQYRNEDKKTRRKKIGCHGHITAEQAREMAKAIVGDVAKGQDPSVKPLPKAISPKIEDLAEKYIKLHAENEKRPKSIREDKALLRNYILKEFGTWRVDTITLEDIQRLHVSLNKKRVLSNRILALLHKMFNLAVQWRWRTDNPVSGIKKYQEYKRTRWLQEHEMKTMLCVLDAYSNQKTANIIRLLLLTGARKHEVLEATWDQFDLEKKVWTRKAHTTKQKKMEHSPLSLPALTILKAMKKEKIDSPFLFPGKLKDRPLQSITKAWTNIITQANLKDFRIHDLRHTYASYLVSSGLSLSIVGKLLGHTQASTTLRYAHLADEPLRQATSLFAEKFKELSNLQN